MANDVLIRREPVISLLDHVKPEAPDTVNVEHQKENHLSKPKTNLHTCRHPQVGNNPAQPKYSNQLENAKYLESVGAGS